MFFARIQRREGLRSKATPEMLLYCSLSFVPCEINRPFRFKGYTYLSLQVMEEDNHTSEYVAIELTPK